MEKVTNFLEYMKVSQEWNKQSMSKHWHLIGNMEVIYQSCDWEPSGDNILVFESSESRLCCFLKVKLLWKRVADTAFFYRSKLNYTSIVIPYINEAVSKGEQTCNDWTWHPPSTKWGFSESFMLWNAKCSSLMLSCFPVFRHSTYIIGIPVVSLCS